MSGDGNAELPDAASNPANRRRFLEQVAAASASAATRERLRRQRDLILRLLPAGLTDRPLRVADIGGGAGTLAWLWAERGESVHCLDIDLTG